MNPLTDLVFWLGALFVASAIALLATDLAFWLDLGNFLSASAVALFAIKSGYYDKKINSYEKIFSSQFGKFALSPISRDHISKKDLEWYDDIVEKYERLKKQKDWLDKHFPEELMCILFFGGLAIQFLSLFASTIIIAIEFNSTIEIAIRVFFIILDKIIHISGEILKIVWK